MHQLVVQSSHKAIHDMPYWHIFTNKDVKCWSLSSKQEVFIDSWSEYKFKSDQVQQRKNLTTILTSFRTMDYKTGNEPVRTRGMKNTTCKLWNSSVRGLAREHFQPFKIRASATLLASLYIKSSFSIEWAAPYC